MEEEFALILVKEFAKGLAGKLGGGVGAQIIGFIFPAGSPPPLDLQKLCDSIKDLLADEFAEDHIDTVNGDVAAAINYFHGTYAGLKAAHDTAVVEGTTDRWPLAELEARLQTHVDSLARDVAQMQDNAGRWITHDEKWESVPGMAVYLLLGNMYLALLQEQILVDWRAVDPVSNKVDPWRSAFIQGFLTAAGRLADSAEREWEKLKKERLGKIHFEDNPGFGGRPPSLFWNDEVTGITWDGLVNYKGSPAEKRPVMKKDYEKHRAAILSALAAKAGHPDEVIGHWRGLATNPLPPPVPGYAHHAKRFRNNSSTGIYLVLDGMFRVFPDPETYFNLFADQANLGAIASSEEAYPLGLPITAGAYLARTEGRLYLVIDGTKRSIPNWGVFDFYGFDRSKIQEKPGDKLTAIPFGPDIP